MASNETRLPAPSAGRQRAAPVLATPAVPAAPAGPVRPSTQAPAACASCREPGPALGHLPGPGTAWPGAWEGWRNRTAHPLTLLLPLPPRSHLCLGAWLYRRTDHQHARPDPVSPTGAKLRKRPRGDHGPSLPCPLTPLDLGCWGKRPLSPAIPSQAALTSGR